MVREAILRSHKSLAEKYVIFGLYYGICLNHGPPGCEELAYSHYKGLDLRRTVNLTKIIHDTLEYIEYFKTGSNQKNISKSFYYDPIPLLDVAREVLQMPKSNDCSKISLI